MSFIENHLNAGYPLLLVESSDEKQVLRDVSGIEGRLLATYSATGTIRYHGEQTTEDSCAWHQVWTKVTEQREEGEQLILVVFDSHHFLENANMYRALIEALDGAKATGQTIVLVAPSWQSRPVELEHYAPILEYGMPSRDQLNHCLEELAESQQIKVNGNRTALLDAAAGLTIEEAENAFALSLASEGELIANIVANEKMRLIKSTGFMSVAPPMQPEDIGGLSSLKTYLEESAKYKSDPQLAIRALAFVGPPGVGKSLCSKASGAAYERPVIGLSLSECKGSHVGESEANLRQALRLAEAMDNCILWVDEADKALGGVASSAETDGGTTLGMLGILLTWLQDHRKSILTLFTVNEFDHLPEALTSRLDESFFVDLPSTVEREAIANIHLDRLNCECDIEFATEVASATEGWSGREIEQLTKALARRSERKPTSADLKAVASEMIPLSKSTSDAFDKLRDRLRGKLRTANTPETKTKATGRKIKKSA